MKVIKGIIKKTNFSWIAALVTTITILTFSCDGSGSSNGGSDEVVNNTPGVVVTGLPGDGTTTINGCTVFQPFLIDMNGDTELDLLVGTVETTTDPDTHKVLYFTNNGSDPLSFTFDSDLISYEPGMGTPTNIMFTAAGTVNNNSNVDLFLVSNTDRSPNDPHPEIQYYEDAYNAFDQLVPEPGNSTAASALSNLNGDAYLDLVLGIVRIPLGDGIIATYTGDNYGSFSNSLSTIVTGLAPVSDTDTPVPALVNMDADSALEMYVTLFESGTILYYDNNNASTPNFSSATDPLGLDPPDGESWFMTFGHLDGDASIDAIIGTDTGGMFLIEDVTE